MRAYQPEDFQAYYGGAWFIHPEDKTICRTVNVGDGNATVMCATATAGGEKGKPVDYRDLTFEMFNQCSPLGYRHIEKGKYLFYLAKRSMRRRAKGLRNDSIIINGVPEVDRLYALANKQPTYRNKRIMTKELLEEIFFPSYVTLEDAVKVMEEDNLCAGLALSCSLALTLNTAKTSFPYLLLFKGERAASSADGKEWKATHEEYKKMLRRHIPTIRFQGDY